MGRSEQPIPRSSKHELRYLAAWLRRQRTSALLSYRELSEETGKHAGGGFSAATLSRAAAGTSLPRLEVVDAFAQGCGADRDRAATLWRRAAAADAYRTGEVMRRTRVQPETVTTLKELSEALRHIRIQAGRPSLHHLEQAAGPGRLPHSSVALVLNATQFPSAELLAAFLDACNVTTANKNRWMAVRRRLVDQNPLLAAREAARSVPPPLSPCDAVEEAAARNERSEELKALRRTSDYDDDYPLWAEAQ